jgi:hypothetical protein
MTPSEPYPYPLRVCYVAYPLRVVIRTMPEKILVHEKALGHLTRGLYRSPASAIRELVSNAWDANATEVRVSTSRPSFHRLSVSDNGDGFSRGDFVRLMAGFGNSDKRATPVRLKYGREMIGRLGIGMLGIAQICGSFVIRSRPRKGRGFTADIRLSERLRERIDSEDSGIVDDTLSKGEANLVDSHRIMVGEYDFLPGEDWEKHAYGTVIETDDLIPTFSHAFRSTYEQIATPPTSAGKPETSKPHRALPIPTTWAAFLKRCASSATVQELGDYWRFMWDLSALCPLPYLTATSLPNRVASAHHARLLKYKFRVLLDDLELRKPVDLRGNPGGYTSVPIKRTSKQVLQRELTLSGYIVVQEGRQLRPSELRGTLVRIRDVGVGLYDASLLDYRINEGPRSRWLTSELFVESGLEDALNIDRDSFNRYSPEFQVLQREYHSVLQKEVFPEVYKQIEKRAQTRQHQRSKSRLHALVEVIGEALTDQKVEIRVGSAASVEQPEQGLRVSITDKRVQIVFPRDGLAGTAKAYRSLAAAILAIYDVSQGERDPQKRRIRFVTLLRDLLRQW